MHQGYRTFQTDSKMHLNQVSNQAIGISIDDLMLSPKKLTVETKKAEENLHIPRPYGELLMQANAYQ